MMIDGEQLCVKNKVQRIRYGKTIALWENGKTALYSSSRNEEMVEEIKDTSTGALI